MAGLVVVGSMWGDEGKGKVTDYLAQKADVMIVIGGRNSANTTRLAEICATYCNNTHHVETADELAADWFQNAEIIGITAGASTPASQIASVQTQIEQLCHD